MSFGMMKAGQFSAFVSALDKVHQPIWICAIALLSQQQIQQNANLWHRQRRGIFCSPDAVLLSRTMAQYVKVFDDGDNLPKCVIRNRTGRLHSWLA